MKKESGQTLVEFALAFPLLALILFAIIQYGFIFGAQMSLRHAAQITCRTLCLAGVNYDEAETRTLAEESLGPLLDAERLTTVDRTGDDYKVGGRDAIKVTLAYDMPLIIQFVVPGASDNSITLTAAGIDRKN